MSVQQPTRSLRARLPRIIILGVLVLIAGVLLTLCCISPPPPMRVYPQRADFVDGPPQVNVLLLDDKASCTLAVGGRFNLVLPSGERVTRTGVSGAVTPTGSGLRIGNESVDASSVRIVPESDGDLKLNDTAYRGTVLLSRTSAGRLAAINTVDLETYLISVVGTEMSSHWPAAALRAQAIAARSYALYKMKIRHGRFHLFGDTRDQAYGGVARENWAARDAVEATRGVVVVYSWSLFPAYYHATCGGRTRSSMAAFDLHTVPSLGGTDCGFCAKGSYYRWEASVPMSELIGKLRGKGYTIDRVSRVETMSADNDAGADQVKLVHSRGSVMIDAETFREMVGRRLLRSRTFTASVDGDTISFSGRGWGHGVGMCQWGARGMAEVGYTEDDILLHYYSGADLIRVY